MFKDHAITWRNAVNEIISIVFMSGNGTRKHFSSSMTNFCIIKSFGVYIQPPIASSIIEVLWSPPLLPGSKLTHMVPPLILLFLVDVSFETMQLILLGALLKTLDLVLLFLLIFLVPLEPLRWLTQTIETIYGQNLNKLLMLMLSTIIPQFLES